MYMYPRKYGNRDIRMCMNMGVGIYMLRYGNGDVHVVVWEWGYTCCGMGMGMYMLRYGSNRSIWHDLVLCLHSRIQDNHLYLK